MLRSLLIFVFLLSFIGTVCADDFKSIYLLSSADGQRVAEISADDKQLRLTFTNPKDDRQFHCTKLQSVSDGIFHESDNDDTEHVPFQITGLSDLSLPMMQCEWLRGTEKSKLQLEHIGDVHKYHVTLIPNVDLDLEWPDLITVSPLRQKLQVYLDYQVRQKRRAMLADARSAIAEEGNDTKYNWETIYQIRYIDDQFVSILIQTYTYTGGAHGNTGSETINLILIGNELKPITYNDIFTTTESRAAVNQLFLKQCGELGATSVKDGSAKVIDDLTMNTFTFTPKGLTLHVSPYELGCYAEGAYAPELPWKMLVKFVDKKSVINSIMK